MHHWSKLEAHALVNMEIIDLLNALHDIYQTHSIIHIHAKLFYHLSFTIISFLVLELPYH